MGLFNKKTWVTYQDLMDNKKMSVRVNTIYMKKMYSHTYCVQLEYGNSMTIDLPTVEFVKEVCETEDIILEILLKLCSDKVVHLGTASFGGSSYIVFASNFNMKWVEMLSHYMGKPIVGQVYLNDNMNYYNQVLYPSTLRK